MSAPFFVGWGKTAPAQMRFLAVVSVILIAAFGAGAYVGAVTQPDPGAGSFRWDWGQVVMTGTVEARPYPILHVDGDARAEIASRTVLLSGQGKRGAQAALAALGDGAVTARGVMLRRGDLLMLQLSGRPTEAEDRRASQIDRRDLGRWRLSGEICDGRCYVGGMRPGQGIAHKACANLCLRGGLPPVFVTTEAVDGHTHFLLGASGGGPISAATLDFTAQRITVEGQLEIRGDLAVFLIDEGSLAAL